MSLETSLDDGVAVITLNWPERRNALTPDDGRELGILIEDLSLNGTANVIVLTGNGAFCSGGHLDSLSERATRTAHDHRRSIASGPQRAIRAIVSSPIPVLAAIDGPAVGLGLDLALACDHRLVGPSGWLMQGWGRIGVIPGTGGVLLLRRLNPTVLWRLLATQERLDGPAAERLGLAQSVVDGRAIDAAMTQAASLARQPREVLELYVALHRGDLRAGILDHLDMCAREESQLLADPALADRIARLRNTN